MSNAREIRLRGECEQRRPSGGSKRGTRIESAKAVVESDVLHSGAALAGGDTQSVYGIMIVGGQRKTRTVDKRERLGDHSRGAARIGGEHDVVLAWIGVEELQGHLARRRDRLRARKGWGALGMRVANDRRRETRGISLNQ